MFGPSRKAKPHDPATNLFGIGYSGPATTMLASSSNKVVQQNEDSSLNKKKQKNKEDSFVVGFAMATVLAFIAYFFKLFKTSTAVTTGTYFVSFATLKGVEICGYIWKLSVGVALSTFSSYSNALPFNDTTAGKRTTILKMVCFLGIFFSHHHYFRIGVP